MRGIGLSREKVIEKAGELANEKGLNAWKKKENMPVTI